MKLYTYLQINTKVLKT